MLTSDQTIGCVFSCGTDEDCLPEFMRSWKGVSDIPLVLISDIDNPIVGDYGLPVILGEWPKDGPICRGVISSLLSASELFGSKHVIKLDCDMIHFSTGWLSLFEEGDLFGGVGYDDSLDSVMGAIYFAEVESLRDIQKDSLECDIKPDDRGITSLYLKRFPDNCRILDNEHHSIICGFHPEVHISRYERFSCVHIGQYMDGRHLIPQHMKMFNSYHDELTHRHLSIKNNDVKYLKDFFDRIVMISLPSESDRRDRAIDEMLSKGLIETKDDIIINEAVRGDELPPPAYWRAGNGAWGCLMSHVRAIQDAHMDREAENVLLLEDDVIWSDDAIESIENLMSNVPKNWGQIYLGGQHRRNPEVFCEGVLKCKSVNRTHAFAINRWAYSRVLQHILYSPDHINDQYPLHIDHSLEIAHRRGDWGVFGPRWWVAAQGENHSSINGRRHPDKWWDWNPDEAHKKLPLVILDASVDHLDSKLNLHCGWDNEMDADGKNMKINRASGSERDTFHALCHIAWEAFDQRGIPCVKPLNQDHLELIKSVWPSNVMLASKCRSEDILETYKKLS